MFNYFPFQLGQHVNLIQGGTPSELPGYKAVDTPARQLAACPLHRVSYVDAVQQVRWQSIPGRCRWKVELEYTERRQLMN